MQINHEIFCFPLFLFSLGFLVADKSKSSLQTYFFPLELSLPFLPAGAETTRKQPAGQAAQGVKRVWPGRTLHFLRARSGDEGRCAAFCGASGRFESGHVPLRLLKNIRKRKNKKKTANERWTEGELILFALASPSPECDPHNGKSKAYYRPNTS